ncbi:MAG: O-antigen ligase family protein [Patescibacteria group bacterium]
MKLENLKNFCDRVLEYGFYSLFFLVPLVMTPLNFELFEFNKMMLTYALTVIIVGAWLCKMVLEKRILFKRSPFDIPLLIFLISQFLSFFFSIDRHTSLFGYYSRFHGGLLSTFSYLLLYWAFVSIRIYPNPSASSGQVNPNKSEYFVLNCIKVLLFSGFLVAGYGVLEHFGIDAKYWVQDVKNRVFSTLGQPNWLAAWLAALLPVVFAFFIINRKKKTALLLYCFIALLLILSLLYTKSRSGIPAAFLSLILFFFLLAIPKIISFRKRLLYPLVLLFVIILAGSGFWGLKILFKNTSQDIAYILDLTDKVQIPIHQVQDPGSESGDIRKVVWRGAAKIWKNYPIFGSGVETFAYSYYNFRPIEHNLLSEWDFLYNKAHNEYLNLLATTGLVGLSSYLLFILAFVIWFIRMYPNINNPNKSEYSDKKFGKFKIRMNSDENVLANNLNNRILVSGLFAGFTSILITNFFGFSIVPVALLFFLYPAMAVVLTRAEEQESERVEKQYSIHNTQYIILVLILFAICCLLFATSRMWYADVLYARGNRLNKQGIFDSAFNTLQEAISLNPSEPLYHDELAWSSVNLAVWAAEQKQTSTALQLAQFSVNESDRALKTSPKHLNFLRTRAKVFYKLSTLDPAYYQQALQTLLTASQLAPTDAKISYNLGLVYYQLGQRGKAIETLRKTLEMKPNYLEAKIALEAILKETSK